MRRLLTNWLPAAGIFVAVVSGAFIVPAMARQSDRDSVSDWAILLLPFLLVLVCLGLSLAALFVLQIRSSLWRGALRGAFFAAVMFSVLQTLAVAPRHDLVATDGTAYWGLAFLPALYIGVPLLLVGSITGALLSALLKRKLRCHGPV